MCNLSHPYNWLAGGEICIPLLYFIFAKLQLKKFWVWAKTKTGLLRQNNSKSIWRVSNILDLQHVHVFKFNPQLHVGHIYSGIDYEHVNMLKIQNVWNLSDGYRSFTLWKYFEPFARLIRWCFKSSNTNCNTYIKLTAATSAPRWCCKKKYLFTKK